MILDPPTTYVFTNSIGYNGTVLAYGQTGAGKTYSMGSAHCVSQASVLSENSGVIPRVINDIFERIQNLYEYEYLLKVQYAEVIYYSL